MNRIYRLVFNRRLNVMQVASELATQSSGGSTSGALGPKISLLSRSLWLAMGASAFWSGNVLAQEVINGERVIASDLEFAEGFIAGDGAKGAVTVRSGALVTSKRGVYLGRGTAGAGTLKVEGEESILYVEAGPGLVVGDSGSGELVVSDRGTVVVASDLDVALDDGSSGSVSVNGRGSSVDVRGNMNLGHAGKATLDVTDGAELRVGKVLAIGARDSSAALDAFTVEANISGGAQVYATEGTIISAFKGGQGRLVVDGTGSLLDSTELHIGRADAGWLVVSNGATVRGERLLAEEVRPIQGDSDQAGHIHFTGADTRVEFDDIRLSEHSLLDEGVSVVSNSARIQDTYATDTGTIFATMRGAGTSWKNSGKFEFATNFDIIDGATLESSSISIDNGSKPVASSERIDSVRVASGGRLLAFQDLKVGGGTLGSLNIAEGGAVAVAGNGIQLLSQGYLSFGGGIDRKISGSIPVGELGVAFKPAEAAGALDPLTVVRMGAVGSLVFNHTADDYEFSNTLVSESSLVPLSGQPMSGAIWNLAGTTILSGDVGGYSGNITVTGGKLVVDSDTYRGNPIPPNFTGAVPAQSLSVSSGTLIVNNDVGFLQDVDFGSSGIVTQRTSTVNVKGAGVFGGTGAVGKTTVMDGGVISPGDGNAATLTIDGDLEFNYAVIPSNANHAFYDVDILGNGVSDLLKVRGWTNIGSSALSGSGDSTVRVTALDPHASYQNGQSYVIIDSEKGVAGTFADVISRSAFVTPTLTYTPTTVVLNIAVAAAPAPAPAPAPPPVVPVNPNPPAVFGAVAGTGNQAATASALDTLVQSGEALALYNNLLMHSADEARLAFNDLSGDVHANHRALLLEDRYLVNGIVRTLGMSAEGLEAGTTNAWVSAGGSRATLDADGNAGQVRSNGVGAAVGMTLQLSDSFGVGAAIGYQDLRMAARERVANLDADARYAGLYANWELGQAYVRGGGTYADYDMDSQRSVYTAFAPLQSIAAQSNATTVTFFAETGYGFQWDAFTLTPYLQLAHTRLKNDAFVEQGGSAALAVAAQKDEWWSATGGVRGAWAVADGAEVSFGLGWQHAGGDENLFGQHRFVAGSRDFTVSSVPMARNVGLADASVTVNTSTRSRLSMSAQARSGDGLKDLGAHLNWRIGF